MKLRPAKTIWLGLMCLAALTCLLPLEPVDKYLVFVYLLSALFLGYLLALCGRLGRTVLKQQAALNETTGELHRLSSDSRQVRSQLERQTALYHGLLKAVPMGLYWKDREGKLLGYNPEYAHIAGLKRMEEGLSSAQTEIFEARQEGLPVDMEVMDKDVELLFLPHRMTQNGVERNYLVSKIAIKDSSGMVCGLLGGVLNQDLLKNVQDRSLCSYLKHQCAAESLPTAAVDAKGRIVYVNTALRKALHIDDAMLQGQDIAAIFDASSAACMRRHIEDLNRNSLPDGSAFVIQNGSGWFMVMPRPIYEGTTLKTILFTLTEVSALKHDQHCLESRLYRCRRALNAIRARLAAIRRLTHLSAAGYGLPAAVDHCLETIANLDVLSMENEEPMKTPHTLTPLRQLAQTVRDGIVSHYEQPLQLTVHIGDGCPLQVEADAAKLRQAMMILAELAIEARADALTLGAEMVAAEQGKTVVCLFVEYAGIMPQGEQITAILDPNVSLLTWYRDCQQRDLAVGLRIAARLLNKAGYRLRVDPLDGRMRYAIDIAAAETPATDPIPAALPPAPPTNTPDAVQAKRILIVDDVVENQMLLEAVFSNSGWKTFRCGDGCQAVQLCRHETFDVILMDMRMPQMDGLEATRQIRSDSVNRGTPILAMTASDDKDDQLAAMEAGCDDYLTKPINCKLLEQKVSRYAAKAQQLRLAAQGQDIASFLEGNPDYHQAIETFVGGLPQRIEELRQALEHNDMQELAFKTHALKGLGGFAGFPVYTEKAAQIEQAISVNDVTAIQQQIDEMVQLCQRTRVRSDAK